MAIDPKKIARLKRLMEMTDSFTQIVAIEEKLNERFDNEIKEEKERLEDLIKEFREIIDKADSEMSKTFGGLRQKTVNAINDLFISNDVNKKLSEKLNEADDIIANISEKIANIRDGRDGKDGKDGEKGDKGDRGERGEAGKDGKDGKDFDLEEFSRLRMELVDLIEKEIRRNKRIQTPARAKIEMLGDVRLTNLADNEILQYDSATKMWKNEVITGGATPGGSDTQIQFNDGGSALGGDADFTWNKTTNTLRAGVLEVNGTNGVIKLHSSPTTDLTISAGSITGAGDGRALEIDSGNADTAGNGGQWTARSGAGGSVSGNGGDMYMVAAGARAGTAGAGGNIFFRPGAGDGAGTNGIIAFQEAVTASEAQLDLSNLTSNRIFSFPDEAGTFAVGSGTSTRIAVWDTSNTLGSYSGFTYTSGTSTLAVTNITMSGNLTMGGNDILTLDDITFNAAGGSDFGSASVGIGRIYIGTGTSTTPTAGSKGLQYNDGTVFWVVGSDNLFPAFYTQRSGSVASQNTTDNTLDYTNLYQGDSGYKAIALMFGIAASNASLSSGGNGVIIGDATNPPELIIGLSTSTCVSYGIDGTNGVAYASGIRHGKAASQTWAYEFRLNRTGKQTCIRPDTNNKTDIGDTANTLKFRNGYFVGSVNAGTFVPTTQQTYSVSNVTTDRTYDANSTTVDELADVLGSLIADLRAIGLIL